VKAESLSPHHFLPEAVLFGAERDGANLASPGRFYGTLRGYLPSMAG
jgi:hypothetical protein